MIHIIIPVFNRWHFTKSCLIHLKKQTFSNFKIIVVDDGSTDNTAENLANEFPDVIVLRGDGSLWWTGGINLGLQYALNKDAEYILSLNNDTLPKADYIEKLMESALTKPNSLIGSTGVNVETKAINFCGERKLWLTDSVEDLRKEIDKSQTKQLFKVSHFPGRGLLIPKKIFDTIGLFDEVKFPHYLADYDFTFRASREGFDIYCSLDAQLGTYPEASGANELIANKNWGNYKEHLFGMKGAANLKYYFTYVFRHCPWYLIPISISFGTAKRLFSYWLK